MEAAAGVAAAVRNGGVTMPLVAASSSFEPSHEEWRVVSEQSVRNSGNEVKICLYCFALLCGLRFLIFWGKHGLKAWHLVRSSPVLLCSDLQLFHICSVTRRNNF